MVPQELAKDIYARMIAAWIASGRPLEPNTVEGFAEMSLNYANIFHKKIMGK